MQNRKVVRESCCVERVKRNNGDSKWRWRGGGKSRRYVLYMRRGVNTHSSVPRFALPFLCTVETYVRRRFSWFTISSLVTIDTSFTDVVNVSWERRPVKPAHDESTMKTRLIDLWRARVAAGPAETTEPDRGLTFTNFRKSFTRIKSFLALVPSSPPTQRWMNVLRF